MTAEALPGPIENIREKSLLIRRGTKLPEFLDAVIKFKAKRVFSDWTLIGQLRFSDFQRIQSLGWFLFFIPPEVQAAALAFNRRRALGRALKKILRRVEADKFNTVEITGCDTKEVLGVRYARLAGYMRHLQAGPFLFRPESGAASDNPAFVSARERNRVMTNLELKEAVVSELSWEPSIDAAEIAVIAKDGVVTLSGRVHSYWERYAAERAAERVQDVVAVVNELEVHLPKESERTDEEIAQAAVNALKWSILVPAGKIKVIVSKGWVKLEGTVDWQFQKKAAEKAVSKLVGVRGVTNLVEIKPRIRARKVKASIDAALKRLAELDAKEIEVKVDGDTVTLTGIVHSWFEREEAERAAWAAPGIRRVEDHLIVMT